MAEPVDLELTLRRQDSVRFALDIAVSLADSDVEIRPLGERPVLVQIEYEQLMAVVEPRERGQILTRMLFADPRAVNAFAQACAVARSRNSPVRLRLKIAADAAELHALQWELLRDPTDDTSLGFGEQIYLTRYLAGADWQPIRLRARSQLRTLISIAAPLDSMDYGLSPIRVVDELRLAALGRQHEPVSVLAGSRRPTLAAIMAQLREGQDIYYLVAHGRLIDGEPWLYLEDAKGRTAPVAGAEFAKQVAELAVRPRLVVLVSCESAGDGVTPTLLALGPQLAEAGVPAVVAMRGAVALETASAFLTTFTRELRRDGHIERAVSVARGAVREQLDGSAPVLFSRLRSGRIWYVPGFAADEASFERWPALIRSVREGRCTPILGIGLLESLIGSTRDLARRWADHHGFPLSPAMREDLPQVAQYIAVKQDDRFIRSELREAIRAQLLQRFGNVLPELVTRPEVPLDELVRFAGELRAKDDPTEPHQALAALPFPLYLTTNPDSLLEAALQRAGRRPTRLSCPWNDSVEQAGAQRPEDPSVIRPLIYHLFGHLREPDSLVLTEDDYFRYLIGTTSNNALIPPVVRYRLTDTALLFLGFRLEDWNFRVLFRSVMNDAVRNRRRRNTHVAVQLDLDESQASQPAQARRFLERYFGDADVSIYWGSAEDFIRELLQRIDAREAGAAA